MMRTIPRWVLPLSAGRSAIAVLLLMLLTALTAAAGEPQRLRYQIEVAAVQVGTIEVEAERNARMVETRVEWDMGGGLLGLLGSREEGRLEGRSWLRPGDASAVAPASFAGRTEKEDRRREVRIRYAEDGSIDEFRMTRNGRKRKSDVPERLRDDTVDTLTAFWRIRHWLAGGDRPAEVAVFDGRRRYDLLARRLGREEVEINEHVVKAERIELRLVPRAGFDEDSEVFGSRVSPDEPWADVLVSLDDDPIPLVAIGKGGLSWRIELDEKKG
jgi:hypothetical protein